MHRKHIVLMILCCVIPVAIFAAISLLRIPVGPVAYLGLILVCPISHLLMMKLLMDSSAEHPH